MSEDTFKERFAKLNTKQKEAVTHTEGPLLVVAGPGSGKTELLSLRVAHILRTTDTPANGIYCLTFTEAGARAMRERLLRVIGADAHQVVICTFHGLAMRIQTMFPEAFRHGFAYGPVSDMDTSRIIRNILSSLPYGHPYGSKHPTLGYAHESSIRSRISELKRAGITSEEYKELVRICLLEAEQAQEVFAKHWSTSRLDYKQSDWVDVLITELTALGSTTSITLAHTLKAARTESHEHGKMAPISTWRDEYTTISDGTRILSDIAERDKIEKFIHIYTSFETALHEAGLQDFDDMIIETTRVLETNEDVRLSVQEQCLYMLIDEFQDTSAAQMRLATALISDTDPSPNVCVVGDDDQSIYRFQGAHIGNIISFRKRWQSVHTVILDTNYRSHKEVITLGKDVIRHARERLETTYDDIIKLAHQGNSSLSHAKVGLCKYESKDAQYAHIAKEIHTLLNQSSTETIAVLAKNHSSLLGILPYISSRQIDVSYSRKLQVFDMPHVMSVIHMLAYSSLRIQEKQQEVHLIALLEAGVLSLDAHDITQILLIRRSRSCTLREAIQAHGADISHPHIDSFFTLSESLGGLSLDRQAQLVVSSPLFKDVYYQSVQDKTGIHEYALTLAGLRTLITQFKTFVATEADFNCTIFDWMKHYTETGIPLEVTDTYASTDTRVTLSTSHGSKGLEYDHVFLLDADDSSWHRQGRSNTVSIPTALASTLISHSADPDDIVRLLFVAITRAKIGVNISYTENPLRYLENLPSADVRTSEDEHAEMLLVTRDTTPVYGDDQGLREQIAQTPLSITHIQNFLRIDQGGPAHYIRQNILLYPEPLSNASAYGSIIHAHLEFMLTRLSHGDAYVLDEHLLQLTDEVQKEMRHEPDAHVYVERAVSRMKQFYNSYATTLSPGAMLELNMKPYHITIGDTEITGKIDYFQSITNAYRVLDFKTGKAFASFDTPGDASAKKKAYGYKQQLMMYAVLLEQGKQIPYQETQFGILFIDDDSDHGDIRYAHIESGEISRFKRLVQAVRAALTSGVYNIPEDFIERGDSLATQVAFEDYLIERFS